MVTADHDAEGLLAGLNGRARTHRVAVDGGVVTWRCFGAGPALVLLHGGHGHWLHWARNIDALASRHAVWVPDLPGFGASDAPAEPTLDSLVGATLSSLDLLVGAAAPLAIAGFFLRGLVAANMAARRSSLSRLALVGPGGHGGARRPRGELVSWRDAAARHDDEAVAAAMRHNLLMHMLYEEGAVDAPALRIHTEGCMQARFRSKPVSRAGGLPLALARFGGPLLLIWGEHDVTAAPERAAQLLAQGRTRCTTAIVPAAGHWVQYERAQVVNDLLLAWLDETN